jgi:hypothetical protein
MGGGVPRKQPRAERGIELNQPLARLAATSEHPVKGRYAVEN